MSVLSQGDLPLDHCEGSEHAGVRGGAGEGHADGTSERDQVRHRDLPHSLHAAVQVGR